MSAGKERFSDASSLMNPSTTFVLLPSGIMLSYFILLSCTEITGKLGTVYSYGCTLQKRYKISLFPIAWYPVQRKNAWYTLMRFRLIKNVVAHVYDVCIV